MNEPLTPPNRPLAIQSREGLRAYAPGQAKISLCMIVKNEEHNLGDCLACCGDLVHEIIVVDTGSTDRTKEIAKQAGAKVFDFPWPNSFSKARNQSKKHATGDWIFWMDADDRIDEENRQKLKKLFAGLKDEFAAYLIKVLVLPSSPADPVRVVDHARLFRNHPKVWWHYRVHEQILPALNQLGGIIHATDAMVRHVGYQDASKRPQKLERNRKLLELDHQDDPNDAFTLYNLGRICERLGDTAASMPHMKRSLELADPKETFVRKLYSQIAQAHHKYNQKAQMLQYCLAGLARFPEEVELLFLAGSVLYELNDPQAAAACLERLLALPPSTRMDLGDDLGVRGFKARTQLGRIYRDLKRSPDAEKQFREALKEQPGFGQALLGLGQTLLDQKRFDDLEKVVAELEATPQGGAEAAVLRGLRLVHEKKLDEAKRVAEEAVLKYPQFVEPRILLSRLIWRERDKNPGMVEKALRDILALDPANAEAKKLLEKLQGGGARPVGLGK